ncbi:MAG: hypothetical protein AABZ31_10585 [Bdellovibrionota bacterium]
MAYTNTDTNLGYKTNKKSGIPADFNTVKNSAKKAVDKDLSEISNEATGYVSEATGISQRLIGDVKAQGEAVLGQIKSLASEYGLELSKVRSLASRAVQKSPATIVLGAICVGFAAGFLAKSAMSKPVAE